MKAFEFDRDKYLRECLATKMKAFKLIRRVRVMADGIAYESDMNGKWQKSKLSNEEISRVTAELWP